MAKKNEQSTQGRSESRNATPPQSFTESEGISRGSSEGIANSHSTQGISTHSTTSTSTSSASNRPLRLFRLKGVKVSVFENRTEQGAFYKTSLQKVYRDGEEWKTTTSLSRDDLPVARLLLGRAWEFILETEAGLTSQETQTTTSDTPQRSQHESSAATQNDTTHSMGRNRSRGTTTSE